jgi:hypothetical protein
MQHNASNRIVSGRPGIKHTATMSSSGVSSSVSTFDPVSTSATSISGADDEDWRGRAAEVRREREEKERARKAQAAAKALTAGIDPMGAFGANRPLGHPGHLRTGQSRPSSHTLTQAHVHGQPSHRLHLHTIEDDEPKHDHMLAKDRYGKHYDDEVSHDGAASVSVETAISSRNSYSQSTMTDSTATIRPPDQSPPQAMNRPKLKGQIQSLAKMLSGLKTKSKD